MRSSGELRVYTSLGLNLPTSSRWLPSEIQENYVCNRRESLAVQELPQFVRIFDRISSAVADTSNAGRYVPYRKESSPSQHYKSASRVGVAAPQRTA